MKSKWAETTGERNARIMMAYGLMKRQEDQPIPVTVKKAVAPKSTLVKLEVYKEAKLWNVTYEEMENWIGNKVV